MQMGVRVFYLLCTSNYVLELMTRLDEDKICDRSYRKYHRLIICLLLQLVDKPDRFYKQGIAIQLEYL